MENLLGNIIDNLPYFTIPFVSAFVGWITNLIAIKMTFYPLKYRGIRPFGWQGIIPSKARKMAETAVDLWTSKLIDLETQFAKIKPEKVAEEMTPSIDYLSKEIIDEVMEAKMPRIWRQIPEVIKKNLYEDVGKSLPVIVEEMMKDIKRDFSNMLDLKTLAVSSLTRNKKLLNQMFLKCGEQEFRFIIRSGFYFGFLFGLIQMLVWYFIPMWWILPVFGILVGYFTNYLALQLIFRPLKPIKIGNLSIQGMFIKRQREVSEEYSRMVASNIITIESIFEYIIRGPGSTRLRKIVRRQIDKTINETAGVLRSTLEAYTGSRMFVHIRNIACFRFMQELPMNIRHVFGYAENALDLEAILREKMSALSPIEFEAFLRPVFKEDETTLILIGAALGGIAGLAQYFIAFS
ncbi:MAG: hypothetical protein U5K79_00525 [Cyclobacteriaceae bacterium]|nr:hypothetical protein [Cyclobacteriaceae bacterium]